MAHGNFSSYRVVSQALGRNDLADLPELDTLADKRMLFKLTEAKEIINQFLSLHWIDMSHVDTDAECVEIGSEVVSDHKSKVVSLL
ncbi:hypothetical protein QL285_006195 [Trifolium repens]|nr:hypothetical protein QL285_006195 [Trifolium repens]